MKKWCDDCKCDTEITYDDGDYEICSECGGRYDVINKDWLVYV